MRQLRKYLLPAVLLIAATAWPAYGQIAPITVPDECQEHSLVDVSTTAEGAGYIWFVIGPRNFERWVPTAPGNRAIAFTGPPGSYKIMLVVGLADGSFTQGTAVLTIEGDEPVPPPPPPVPGDLALVVIEESDPDDPQGRDPEIALRLLTLQKVCTEKKVHWQVEDRDLKDAKTEQTPDWFKPLLAAVGDKQLPVLLVCSIADGAYSVVAAEDELPATAAEVEALIDRYEEPTLPASAAVEKCPPPPRDVAAERDQGSGVRGQGSEKRVSGSGGT